jgi:hypothetical protein
MTSMGPIINSSTDLSSTRNISDSMNTTGEITRISYDDFVGPKKTSDFDTTKVLEPGKVSHEEKSSTVSETMKDLFGLITKKDSLKNSAARKIQETFRNYSNHKLISEIESEILSQLEKPQSSLLQQFNQFIDAPRLPFLGAKNYLPDLNEKIYALQNDGIYDLPGAKKAVKLEIKNVKEQQKLLKHNTETIDLINKELERLVSIPADDKVIDLCKVLRFFTQERENIKDEIEAIKGRIECDQSILDTAPLQIEVLHILQDIYPLDDLHAYSMSSDEFVMLKDTFKEKLEDRWFLRKLFPELQFIYKSILLKEKQEGHGQYTPFNFYARPGALIEIR